MPTSLVTISNRLNVGHTPIDNATSNQVLYSSLGILQQLPYAFPTADGSANQVLKTDGLGALTWVSTAVELAIGDAVTGGGANRVLFENASGNLATDAGFLFNASGSGYALDLTETWITGSTNDYALGITPTLNDGGAAGGSDVFRGIKFNLIPTAVTGWNSIYLFDFQYNSSSIINATSTALTIGGGTAVSVVIGQATGLSFFGGRLQVVGPGANFSPGAGGGVNALLNVFSDSTAAINVGGSLGFGGQTGNAVTPYIFAGFKGAKETAAGDGSYKGYLAVYVTDNGGNFVEQLRVASDGDVTGGAVGSWVLQNVTASSTAPTFCPHKDATTTGIGAISTGWMDAIAGGLSVQRWGCTGTQALANMGQCYYPGITYTSSDGAGTYASWCPHNIQRTTLASSNAITVTDLAEVYIANAPLAAASVTATNSWALWVDDGNCRFDGNVIAGTVGSWALQNVAASATVPTLCPDSAGTATGLGGDADTNLSIIVNSLTKLQLDLTVTATHTALLLWDVDNATLERVTVGASDSGGAGFKVLRIPN